MIDRLPKRREALGSLLGLVAGVAGGSAQAATADHATSAANGDIAPCSVGSIHQRRIDVHAHYVPDKYRSALEAAGHSKPSGMPGIPQWSVDLALATMDRLDIETALLSISAPGVHFGDDAAARALARYVNEEGARTVSAHPQRFGLFAVLPLPDVEGALQEIDHAFDVLHVDGVVMESNYHGTYLGEARLDPVFAELDRRGAAVFIHPANPYCPCCQDPTALPPLGYPFSMIEFMFETTRAVFKLLLSGTLDRSPNLKVIVPHAGATVPVLAERVAAVSSMLKLGPSREDLFRTLHRLHYDLAGFPEPVQLGALLKIANPARILYGSDWPFSPEPLVTGLAKQLDASSLINPRMRSAFMRENALALFPRFERT